MRSARRTKYSQMVTSLMPAPQPAERFVYGVNCLLIHPNWQYMLKLPRATPPPAPAPGTTVYVVGRPAWAAVGAFLLNSLPLEFTRMSVHLHTSPKTKHTKVFAWSLHFLPYASFFISFYRASGEAESPWLSSASVPQKRQRAVWLDWQRKGQKEFP